MLCVVYLHLSTRSTLPKTVDRVFSYSGARMRREREWSTEDWIAYGVFAALFAAGALMLAKGGMLI